MNQIPGPVAGEQMAGGGGNAGSATGIFPAPEGAACLAAESHTA